jgi:hypothetical protein
MDNENNETVEILNHDLCKVKDCKHKNIAIDNICLGNFCISCGENLGEHNPRQYCCKTYCPYENDDEDEENNDNKN